MVSDSWGSRVAVEDKKHPQRSPPTTTESAGPSDSHLSSTGTSTWGGSSSRRTRCASPCGPPGPPPKPPPRRTCQSGSGPHRYPTRAELPGSPQCSSCPHPARFRLQGLGLGWFRTQGLGLNRVGGFAIGCTEPLHVNNWIIHCTCASLHSHGACAASRPSLVLVHPFRICNRHQLILYHGKRCKGLISVSTALQKPALTKAFTKDDAKFCFAESRTAVDRFSCEQAFATSATCMCTRICM